MAINFNTSNVTIQRTQSIRKARRQRNFNTSNVTIQLIHIIASGELSVISIHLMLLFNWFICSCFLYNLNISIHLMLLFNNTLSLTASDTALFQYI